MTFIKNEILVSIQLENSIFIQIRSKKLNCLSLLSIKLPFQTSYQQAATYRSHISINHLKWHKTSINYNILFYCSSKYKIINQFPCTAAHFTQTSHDYKHTVINLYVQLFYSIDYSKNSLLTFILL
jgi:hypothetical protein